MTEFKIGDIVRRASGKKPLRLEHQSYNKNWLCRYLHSNQSVYVHENYMVHYDEEEGNEMSTNTLYKVTADGSEFYAIHVGTDSQGRMIVEEKGNGNKIHAISKDQAEEVVPFTFSVRMNRKDYHFQGDADKVKTGDILLYTGEGADGFQIAVVKKTDTKVKTAKPWKGKRLAVEDM